jgi:hypothetical protein
MQIRLPELISMRTYDWLYSAYHALFVAVGVFIVWFIGYERWKAPRETSGHERAERHEQNWYGGSKG